MRSPVTTPTFDWTSEHGGTNIIQLLQRWSNQPQHADNLPVGALVEGSDLRSMVRNCG
jgi:hypothetical protein